MAKRELHNQAVGLRKQGMSYNQIRDVIPVSKGTLSIWLRDMPLEEDRIRELRDNSSVRIERCRETKRQKKQDRLEQVRIKVSDDLGELSEREILIGGLFLYWGEGSKTSSTCCALSNTDPAMIRFFISWVEILGIPKERLRIYLHLYDDMDIESELRYWSSVLQIPESSFRKPYIKKSKRSDLTYQQRFAHGTCNVLCYSRDIIEYTHAAIEHLRLPFAQNLAM